MKCKPKSNIHFLDMRYALGASHKYSGCDIFSSRKHDIILYIQLSLGIYGGTWVRDRTHAQHRSHKHRRARACDQHEKCECLMRTQTLPGSNLGELQTSIRPTQQHNTNAQLVHAEITFWLPRACVCQRSGVCVCIVYIIYIMVTRTRWAFSVCVNVFVYVCRELVACGFFFYHYLRFWQKYQKKIARKKWLHFFCLCVPEIASFLFTVQSAQCQKYQ